MFNWKEIYYVGTEWYIYEDQKDGPGKRHDCYTKLFEHKPEWDFGHVFDKLKELTPAGSTCYLFGGTEGHILSDPQTGDTTMEPVLVPVLCALITTQDPPTKFGIQQKDKDEELVDLDHLGCSWVPLEDAENIKYLSCKHVKDMSAIEQSCVEEQAQYGYANLYIEPEKVEPDADPDKNEDKNIIYVAYSTGQTGAMQIEFDIRRDKLQKVAKRTVEEEELTEEHVPLIEEALRGPVEAAQKKKEAEKQRRAAMEESVKEAWRASLRVKFYPQNDHLQLENKFINRYFERANQLFPVPKVTNAFAFAASNPFFNAGPAVEITDEVPAAAASPTKEKVEEKAEKEEAEKKEETAEPMQVDVGTPKRAAKPKTPEQLASAQKKREEAAAKKAELAAKRKAAAEKAKETRKKKREAQEMASPPPAEGPEDTPTRQLRKKQKVEQ